MTPEIESARVAAKEARDALSAARTAKYDAVRAVEARYAPVISAAQSAVWKAEAALKEAESAAAPDHEWEGKAVYKIDRRYDRWNSARFTDTLLVGTVLTYRPGVDLGPGNRGNHNAVGSTWVRLHKKDGKPGAKCVSIRGRWQSDEDIKWALTEAEARTKVAQ